jgi:DNA anti-recombination protein RmuC
MKFKPRLPLTQSQDTPEENPEQTPPVKPVEQVEARENRPQTGDPLNGAFNAIAQVVRSEMDALRRSIADIETKVGQRLDAEKASMNSAIGDLRQDVISRVESLRQTQQKAIADISEQTKASAASLKGQLEQAREQTNTRTSEIKSGLEQILSAKEEKLVKELEALTHNLSGVRVDLERQMSTSGQVSSLLHNMATVFSDEKALPKDPVRVRASKED